jgi:hypothetical protein
VVLDQIANALDETERLACARSGKHENGPAVRLDCRTLRW